MPKNNAIEEMPGSLKTKFIIGESSLANMFVIAVCCKSSEIIRKGSNDGTIVVVHSDRADFVELSMSLGQIIQKIAIKNTVIEKSM